MAKRGKTPSAPGGAAHVSAADVQSAPSTPARPRIQPPVNSTISDYHNTTTPATPCMTPHSQLAHSWAKLHGVQPEGKGLWAHIDYKLKAFKLQTDFLLGSYFLDWYETIVVYGLYALLLALIVYGATKQLAVGQRLLAEWLGRR